MRPSNTKLGTTIHMSTCCMSTVKRILELRSLSIAPKGLITARGVSDRETWPLASISRMDASINSECSSADLMLGKFGGQGGPLFHVSGKPWGIHDNTLELGLHKVAQNGKHRFSCTNRVKGVALDESALVV
jgi:hypothetical protein